MSLSGKRSSSPARRAASGLRSDCAPRATAPMWRSRPRPRIDPKLPGTIYTAAEEIERAGGKALPLVVDVRDEAMVKKGDRRPRRPASAALTSW